MYDMWEKGVFMAGNTGFDRPVRYALVGLGYFAQEKVLPSFLETGNSEIVALVSDDMEKCSILGKKHPCRYHYTYDRYDDCLANSDIDAIYILLPNKLHEYYTVRALQAGKHVLCEKPMATTPDEALRMVKAARDNQTKLMIGYRMHFEATNQTLKEKIHQQAFGTIKQVYSSNTFNLKGNGWRLDKKMAGGGALLDIGIYPLNNICWLLEQLPTSVLAHTWSTDPKRYKEVEENITFELTFSQGLQVQCMCSYGTARSSIIYVGGNKGWMEISEIYDYRTNPICRTYTVKTEEFREEYIQRNNEIKAEIEHFSLCIQRNKNPEPMGEEGYRDQLLMDALYQSAMQGQPVHLGKESAGAVTFSAAKTSS
jgi:predicted dehydrogenase